MDRIETTECGRCGGSGRYSYNQMHGSRCYGCGGSGKAYTKRGAAAARYLEELRSKPAAEFCPGELMRYDMFTPSGSARVFVTVESVEPSDIKVIINGVASQRPSVTIKGTGKIGPVSMTTSADKLLRQGFDAETKQAQLAEAIAYQATLTVKGKPRKDMPDFEPKRADKVA
jgi:hypothetical protein